MSKIYLGMTSGYGPLAQALPIVNILKDEKGHDIVCNMFGGESRTVLGQLGYKLRDLVAIDRKPENMLPSGREWWTMGYFFGRLGYLDLEYVDRLVSECVKFMKAEKVEAVISVLDPIAAISSKILNIPLISISQACFHPKKTYDRIRWWQDMPDDLTDVTAVFNKIMEKYSLPVLKTSEELFESECTIIPSIKEFDPVTSDNSIYTGIMKWNDCEDKGEGLPCFNTNNTKTIFAYTGRMEDSGGKSGVLILDNIIEAFKNNNYNVLITTGVGELPDEYKNKTYPDNIIVKEWAAIDKIIDNVDMVIHHGGHGISLKTISAGKPSLVIPTHDEREFNARQIEKIGIGDLIIPEEITPDVINKKISAIIDNEAINNNIKELLSKIANEKYVGAQGAADIIDEFIKSH